MHKIEVKLIGEDGNIFNLLSLASRALKREGQNEEAKEMEKRVFESESYEQALRIIGEYVEIS